MIPSPPRPVFRFAPSPNGALHLGHAYSALLNAKLAGETGGRLLLRIEDLDQVRCKREYEAAIVDDLAWLGIVFDPPPRRQSEHGADYARSLASLRARGLVYPCFCSRAEVAATAGGARDPDGAPIYSGACRALTPRALADRLAAGERAALRLDSARALGAAPQGLSWREFGEGEVESLRRADPAAWGDFVVRGKDNAASYHLAVVVDDALQGVTDVARGRDLYAATSAHRLLQALLGLPAPRYRHHRLVLDDEGAKMSKSASSPPLRALRDAGCSARDVRAALGFETTSASPRLGARLS
jgi:glutamyl-Q tRNA(Asp) synthetase